MHEGIIKLERKQWHDVLDQSLKYLLDVSPGKTLKLFLHKAEQILGLYLSVLQPRSQTKLLGGAFLF